MRRLLLFSVLAGFASCSNHGRLKETGIDGKDRSRFRRVRTDLERHVVEWEKRTEASGEFAVICILPSHPDELLEAEQAVLRGNDRYGNGDTWNALAEWGRALRILNRLSKAGAPPIASLESLRGLLEARLDIAWQYME